MADDDTFHCMGEIQQEINVYWAFVYLSLGLTAVNIVVRNCMRSSRISHPERKYRPVSRLFIITGIIKCIFGSLLISVLLPVCPADCSCSQIQIGHFSYGYIALFLGLLWLYQGYVYHKKAEEAVQYNTNQAGIAMNNSKPEVDVTSSLDDDDNELV